MFKFKKKALIDGEEYEDIYIVPDWYMLQLALYGRDNEAAIAELIARCKP